MKDSHLLDSIILKEAEMLEIHGGTGDSVSCGSSCGHNCGTNCGDDCGNTCSGGGGTTNKPIETVPTTPEKGK